MDGVEVIQGLRGWTPVPIIVLSGRGGSQDKVEALDAGADDYVTKPFGMDELLARIRAVTRRTRPRRRPSRRSRPDRRRTRRPGRQDGLPPAGVRLTPTEWQLLEILVRNPGKLISQRQLLSEVWGPALRRGDQLPARSTWPSCAASWRPTPAHPRHLITEPGMGYRFQP